MKTFKTQIFLTLLTFAILSCTSCKKDDDAQPQATANFFAKVNNADFNPQFVSGFSQNLPNNILITGGMSNGEQIQLFIPKNTTTGTYAYGEVGSSHLAYYQKIDGDAFDVAAYASSGSISITEHNTQSKSIKGTFNFSGTIENTQETFTITEGTFELTYEAID